jgi:RNA polymerase sigma-70 factor (ECF subfamily)
MMVTGENPFIPKAVERVKAGDAEAFRIIIREYKSPAYSIAYRILRNAEDAEETVQDAFFNAFKKIHQYKGDSKFASWFLKIVYNLSLTKTRKKRISTVELNDHIDTDYRNQNTGANNWDLIIQEDRETYVRQAIDKLPEDDALILTLFYISDNSIPEICDLTGWSQSSAKVKLHRARQKLYGSLFSLLKCEMKELI